MSREARNADFARTSFLNGVNAAYVEEMQSVYDRDPAAVSEEWRAFFESMSESPANGTGMADGPSWARPLNELNSTGNP